MIYSIFQYCLVNANGFFTRYENSPVYSPHGLVFYIVTIIVLVPVMLVSLFPALREYVQEMNT